MKKTGLFLIAFFILFILQAEDRVVSIYNEFDEGLYGKSIHRGIIVSVKKDAFARAETFKIKNDDESGFLTAVVISRENAERLLDGYYNLSMRNEMGRSIFRYQKEGLDFEFSVEKAEEKLLEIVSEYYKNDTVWHDPLIDYYKENYIIRIHSAENVFDSWSDDISYSEALVVATLIGDSSQWLWGIHDGIDILNKGY